MGKLIYAPISSLDGYIEDENGRFGWAMPDDEVYASVNDIIRPISAYLYGRRMYETMAYWETADTQTEHPNVTQEFAGIWQRAEKIVYSQTLQTASSARTRIENAFNPDAIQQLKQSSETDIAIGGADLAGQALEAGLVDELHLFLCPFLMGAGKRALPPGYGQRLDLLDERRFQNGVVHLHYRLPD